MQSEIYSVGVLLYFLVTGSHPVQGDSRTVIGNLHEQDARRKPLRDVRPDLPDPFIRVVERCTGRGPPQRFPSAGALETALARLLGPASTLTEANSVSAQTPARSLCASGVGGCDPHRVASARSITDIGSRGESGSSRALPERRPPRSEDFHCGEPDARLPHRRGVLSGAKRISGATETRNAGFP